MIRTSLLWDLIHWDAYRGCAGRQDREAGGFDDGGRGGGSEDMPTDGETAAEAKMQSVKRRTRLEEEEEFLHRWMMIILGRHPRTPPVDIYYFTTTDIYMYLAMPSSVYLDSLDVAGPRKAPANQPGVLLGYHTCDWCEISAVIRAKVPTSSVLPALSTCPLYLPSLPALSSCPTTRPNARAQRQDAGTRLGGKGVYDDWSEVM
ncbi:hypothetical protein CSOJ01_15022 [Colletotrichum sojae]|uniref:Uncharacterized protein n=1 Tax=Colletotrichum sojae TaxID=2175907 RepID=A0A8H6INZ1_9PEZI|nr:hypothetical protein CSOJ01_15022 [Colletotrichum sojae]